MSLNGSPAKGSFPTHSRARSCTSHLPSSTTGPVQTQQPCSLKGSLSSDNIYTGPHRDPTGTHTQPGQGDHQQNRTNIKDLFVVFCLIRLEISLSFSYPGVFFLFSLYLFTGWSNYPQTSERVTYKSSSKPRARFLSGPVSLSICLYLLLLA